MNNIEIINSDNDLISRAVESAITFFCNLYSLQISSDIRIILCDTLESLEEEWRKYYGYKKDQSLPLSYDGQFLIPKGKTDQLTILIQVKNQVNDGARQFFKEADKGDAEQPSESRGLCLMAFFKFLELLLHELSHLCSYERMMALTDWADPALPSHNYDYHLHDEFIARIRGTVAMLRIAEPYAETDLIYSLYMDAVNDTKAQFLRRKKEVKEEVERARENLEPDFPVMQEEMGLSDAEMAEEMEYELGHPLEFGYVDGRLKLSDLEIMEYAAVDELAEVFKPYIYALKNPYALYEGTQFTGALTGFYEASCGNSEWEMDLEKVLDIPFWKYLDIQKLKQQDELFREWLMQKAREER